MICIISPTFSKAEKWAHTQNLHSNEWFYANDKSDVQSKKDFHVIVVGEFPQERLYWFEQIYALARSNGRKK
jgi:hypothetical protein